MCCSALQCVTVRCSALQCVAVRCSALQRVVVHCSASQCVAVRCSALQCTAVCCSTLQPAHRALRCNAVRCVEVRCVVLRTKCCKVALKCRSSLIGFLMTGFIIIGFLMTPDSNQAMTFKCLAHIFLGELQHACYGHVSLICKK